jgi:hypothetical protein
LAKGEDQDRGRSGKIADNRSLFYNPGFSGFLSENNLIQSLKMYPVRPFRLAKLLSYGLGDWEAEGRPVLEGGARIPGKQRLCQESLKRG